MVSADLEIHPDALLEAEAAVGWYLERSRRAAKHFLGELERAVERILEAPERWPSYTRGTRRYVLYKFPYSVVYNTSGNLVRIYAIAHAKRRPGYWKVRLVSDSPPTS